MATTQTFRTIPKADFTGAGGNPTPLLFLRDLGDVALSVQPLAVRAATTNIEIEWAALPTAADFALIDTAVTNHAGGVLSTFKTAKSLGESLEDQGTETEKLAIEDINFSAGVYIINWSCETAEADVKVYVDNVLKAADINESEEFREISGTFDIVATNGQILDISLRFNQTTNGGGPPGDGLIRNARLIMFRLGS
jgi:hypothetical protein